MNGVWYVFFFLFYVEMVMWCIWNLMLSIVLYYVCDILNFFYDIWYVIMM